MSTAVGAESSDMDGRFVYSSSVLGGMAGASIVCTLIAGAFVGSYCGGMSRFGGLTMKGAGVEL